MIKNDDQRSQGSEMITDGNWICNLCLDYRTKCSLCLGDPNQKVIPISRENDFEAERELDRQSAAIKRAAWNRHS